MATTKRGGRYKRLPGGVVVPADQVPAPVAAPAIPAPIATPEPDTAAADDALLAEFDIDPAEEI